MTFLLLPNSWYVNVHCVHLSGLLFFIYPDWEGGTVLFCLFCPLANHDSSGSLDSDATFSNNILETDVEQPSDYTQTQ